MKKSVVLLSSLVSLLLWNCKSSTTGMSVEEYAQLPEEERRKPEHALDGIELLDDELEVTLFASEPMMTNPTNMDIDEKGRVWICEAYNYRNELNPNNPYKKKGDRILIMQDTNSDGKADISKVYYQGEDINAALGIEVVGNKVIVSCSPNVFVFTDTNGDDLPDKKEVLFQGIGGEQHDHGMHAFVFGPDGKFYFNYGNAGKGLHTQNGKPILDELGRVINDEQPPYQEGMVFRSNPDGSGAEIMAWNFRNPYELAVDSYGRMWQSDNDDDGNRGTRINYVMDYGNYGYKDEITKADWRVRRTNMEDSVFYQHWHLNDPGVVPNMLQTYAGSPTGIIVYEGNLLPKRYQNQVIHCDAGPNVVRAYPAQKQGAGFEASILPILDGSKRDQWFRPSDITVAPDGSLFIADWYDAGVGGHGMADSLRGRIFRIAPKGVRYTVPTYNFKTPEGAAEALKNPNVAVRYLAWTALNEMQSKAEKALLTLWKGEDPIMRARALWLLAKIKGEEQKYVNEAAKDENEDIRVTAIRIARELPFDFTSLYAQLAQDKSVQVRREVALAIRHKNLPQVWTTLAKQYDGNDRWYLEALGIAADNNWNTLLATWLQSVGASWKENAASRDIVWRSRADDTLLKLAELVSERNDANEAKFYRAFDFQTNTKKNELLLSLLEKNLSPTEKVLVFKHFTEDIVQNKRFQQVLPSVLATIQQPTDFIDIVKKYTVKGQDAKLETFIYDKTKADFATDAAEVLVKVNGLANFKAAVESGDKQKALRAIEIFGRLDKEPVTSYLISLFSSEKLPLDYRKEAMNAMNGWTSEEVLWVLVQNKKVPEDVLPEAQKLLLGTWHSDIRAAATKFFGKSATTSSFDTKELLAIKGDKVKGKEIYASYCVACHVADKQGVDFGPGLSQIGKKLTKEGLYMAILQPSQGVSFGYEGATIQLKDGTELQGIVTSKTENDVMIKFVGSAELKAYKRSEVVKITEMKESLMPAFPLQKQEIVDLVEYLSGLK